MSFRLSTQSPSSPASLQPMPCAGAVLLSPATASLPTVAGLLAAFVDGGEPWLALQAARDRAVAADGLGVFIHLCPAADWTAQLNTLRTRMEASADRGALLSRYPLLGVPFAVKDNIDVEGQPTTAACPAFTRQAQASATVVQRLLDAGALWLGKTNLDQFATGLVGTRSPYGRPACVADAGRIGGGSSSGSAVAVARGIVPFALGTDTAGSGRVPAGFNGLVGMKPTPGRASTAGVLPACRTLDCVSVFTHTVGDAGHVLAVVEGPDAADAYSAFSPGPALLPQRLRLGVASAASQPAFFGDAGYADAWQAACAAAQAAGHTLVPCDFAPLTEAAALLYDGPWVAERHAVVRGLLAQHPDAFDPAVRSVIGRAVAFSATDAFEGQYRLQHLRTVANGLWRHCDALLVPTAPGHPTFAEVDADPIGVNAQLGAYTNFVNLLGWCALALPAGRTARGLPFGVTLIGQGRHDAALLQAGVRWSAESPPAVPLKTPQAEPWIDIAVVGAHLSGLPLNGQLLDRKAVLVQTTATAPCYRLFALPGTTPPKPGLQRCAGGGAAIAVEVWRLPQAAVGSFLALVAPPLGLGSVLLADGSSVHGFVCEGHALAGAHDITAHGGWRAYLLSLSS